MGELHKGDTVFDQDGKPTKIIAVHPIQFLKTYKVCFDDGSEITACSDHLWETHSYAYRKALLRRKGTERYTERYKNRGSLFINILKANAKPKLTAEVLTTEQIRNTLTARKTHINHAIPIAKTIILPEIDLPLDPYTLGVWLGDGTSSCGTITSNDPEIIDYIIKSGFETKKLKTKYSYSIYGLRSILNKMGLLQNKHVPDKYLRASAFQRLSLLQGLMDTDGTITRSGTAEFNNTNPLLSNAVEELCRSLGIKTNRSSRIPVCNGKKCARDYRIRMTTGVQIFRLTRKKNRINLKCRQTQDYRYITSIKEIESVPLRCITVDSPRSIYLCGKALIPTHNSALQGLKALSYLMTPGTSTVLFASTYQHILPEAEYVVRGFKTLFGPLWASACTRFVFRDTKNNAEFCIETIWGSTIKGFSVKDNAGGAALGFGADLIILCEGDEIDNDVYLRRIYRASGRTPTLKVGELTLYRGYIWGLSTANIAGGAISSSVERALEDCKGEPENLYYPNTNWERSVYTDAISALSNPDYDKDKYDADTEMLAKYAPDILATNYEGKVVRSQHLIFNHFIPSIHIKSHVPTEKIREMNLCVGIDDGTSFAAVLVGMDKDKRIWILGDMFAYNWTVDEQAEGIKKMIQDTLGPAFPNIYRSIEQLMDKIGGWVIDKSCRITNTYEEKLGVYLTKKRLELFATLDEINTLFQMNRIFVAEDCVEWIRATNKYTYTRDRQAGNKGVSGYHSHLPDAFRYAVMGYLLESGALEEVREPLTIHELEEISFRKQMDWKQQLPQVRKEYFGYDD